MKKVILSFLVSFLFIIARGNAQNWQTFLSNKDSYFKGNLNGGSQPVSYSGLIRAYHADSVKMSNADSVFYIFKFLRLSSGSCLNVQAGSWLGDRVIIKPNGVNLLFNLNQDSIFIDTKAGLNDSFIVYKFSNSDYVQAKVIELKEDSVLGVIDSVKTFFLTAKDVLGNTVSNPYNGTIFSLSKNNGMTSSLIWAGFPILPDTFLFKAYPGKRMTYRDIYDYNIGDVFQYHVTCTPYLGGNFEKQVISKSYSLNNDTVFYSFRHPIKNYFFIPTPSPHLDSIMAIDTVYESFGGLDNFILNGAYPEQPIVDTSLWYFGGLHYYHMLSNDYNYNGRIEISDDVFNYIYLNGCWQRNLTNDVIDSLHIYVQGAGKFIARYYNNTAIPVLDCEEQLLYYKKGGEEWGTPVLIDFVDEAKGSDNSTINVFPNPTQDKITIESDFSIRSFELFDTQGRLTMQGENAGSKFEINMNHCMDGIYFLTIHSKDKIYHKVIAKE